MGGYKMCKVFVCCLRLSPYANFSNQMVLCTELKIIYKDQLTNPHVYYLFTYVTQSDKTSLIAIKYTYSFNGTYDLF